MNLKENLFNVDEMVKSKKALKSLPVSVRKNLHKLTQLELLYFSIMWSKYGVLKLEAEPGVAKSAIARNIAETLGFEYVDVRLSMRDETDVGLYPVVEDYNDGEKTVKVLEHVVPKWALKANDKPTIIHFEEINRAPLAVRNAALQILLDREIGTEFKFNDNVLMMASGNIGDTEEESDGAEVEELDSAQNNRLIHVRHSLSIDYWVNNYAKDNIHPTIVNYLKAHPERMYQYNEESNAFATPRSWTMLSKFIESTYGKDAPISDFINVINYIATSFVGNAAVAYISYLNNMLKINIDDILNDYEDYHDDIIKLPRSTKSELLVSLDTKNLFNLNEAQINNMCKFLENVNDDERVGYLTSMIDKYFTENITENEKFQYVWEYFSDDMKSVKEMVKPK